MKSATSFKQVARKNSPSIPASQTRGHRGVKSAAKRRSHPDLFPIVGIGASAGGLEAFSELLHHLPTDTGMGFVLVQHLAPEHESILPQLLARTTAMPVHEARHNMQVEPNQIYVIPKNASMRISDGVLKIGPRERSRGRLRSVDFFLQSLAKDRGSLAIGVILSGTDFDGSAGMEAIKSEGGITFAQDETTARFSGMPRHAVDTGYVDIVLPPENIAAELGRLAISLGGAPDEEPASVLTDSSDYKKILQELRAGKKMDLALYKPNTIQRRIKRRMVLNKIHRLSSYVRFVHKHHEELEALYQDVLISVTGFFRDPEVFEMLKEKIFAQIIANRTPDEAVRIWVAGCSTGQEAYSVAMAFLEFAARVGTQIPLQIFASDINEAVLEKARAGSYSRSQVQDLSAERLRRFFVEQDGTFQICKPIREMCVFAEHDLINDPPFSRMDLVMCRNLLIYFEPSLQKKVIPLLHYALKPGGFLVLGSSESVGEFSKLFQSESKPCKIYSKVSVAGHGIPLFGKQAQLLPKGPTQSSAVTIPPLSVEAEAQHEADRITLARFAPVGVVVNPDFDIVQFRGATSHYLEPMPGKASLNVLKMAREGLLMPLRAALHKAKKENVPVRKEGVVVRFNGRSEKASLEVIPLKNLRARWFLILFEPAAAQSAEQLRLAIETEPPHRVGTKEEATAEISRLQNETAALREYLQSTTEQYEATNEELQASNEEAQSANEELQSINEELETTKEELESTNEELNTVNDEMSNRNIELHRINSDLNNVLNSVEMCIVVLAKNLCIRRFTPLAKKVLNIVPTDVGRPITNIRPNIQFPDLEKFITESIEEIRPNQVEVQDKEGRWFSMRVLPYKTVDNKIDGAVLALVEVDAVKRSEERIQSALDYAQGTIETMREPLLVLDEGLRVQSANRSFYHHFRASPEETLGKPVYELGGGHWNIPRLRELLEQILPKNSSFDDFEVDIELEPMGRRTMLLNARRIADTGQQPQRILLAIEDITEREALELLRDSEERYRTLAETLPQLVWTCFPNGQCDYFNSKYMEYTGVPLEKLLGSGWNEFIHPTDRERTFEYWKEALKGDVPYDLEFRIRRWDGEYRWFKVRAVPLRDKSGAIIKWFGTSTDIDESKRAHLLVEESERWLRLLMESVRDFALLTLDNEGRVNGWNPGAEAMFGYTEAEILGKPVAILFTPEDRANKADRQEMETALAKGGSLDERWHLGKDGRWLFLSGAMRVIRDENGQPQGFIKVARDITERKRNEEALRESEERYRTLFNSIDEGFCVIEMIFDENEKPVDYRFLQVSPSFEKQTGLHNAQGKTIKELAPDQEAHWFEIYGKVALTGEPVRFVNEAKALDNRWFDVYAFRLGQPEKRQVAILFDDITERKQNDEALSVSREKIRRHADQLEKTVAERTAKLTETIGELEAFSYSVAHDMRAPLRAMQNFSSILLEEYAGKLDAEAVGYLEKIKSAANRQDSLIQDVLIYTRVLRAGMPLQPVDLQELVSDIIYTYPDIISPEAEIKIEGKLPMVLGNPAALTQCFSNLLGNAIKFVTPGVQPHIKIWAEEMDSDALIWIEDNGIGIDPEDQERIFKMFERISAAKTYSGTGIGLAIVRKAVERMGGKVGVESEPGKGSRFWIQLRKAT